MKRLLKICETKQTGHEEHMKAKENEHMKAKETIKVGIVILLLSGKHLLASLRILLIAERL